MDSEMKRKVIHIGNGFWAFSLAFLSRPIALIVIIVALFLVLVIFRPTVWNRVFEAMARPRDYELGVLIGPSLYIVVVFLVVLLFDFRIAAAAFAMLAFGDGLATVIGTKLGKLKTRSGKTWEGFAAFVVFGSIFTSLAFLVVDIFNDGKAGWALIPDLILNDIPDYPVVLVLILGISVIAGLAELYFGQYLDDNILVPLICVFGLFIPLMMF